MHEGDIVMLVKHLFAGEDIHVFSHKHPDGPRIAEETYQALLKEPRVAWVAMATITKEAHPINAREADHE